MSGSTEPVLEVVEVSKRFPGVLANDRVSLRLYPGRIHGLLGENGSGKSTVIKILSGVQVPDEGEVRVKGSPVRFSDPLAARAAGISTVFQEFSIVRTLTVAENLLLGRLPVDRRGLVDWRAVETHAERILAQLGLAIDPSAMAGNLSVAHQQMVEIGKAVAAGADILILDEPTAALGLDEIAQLHALLRRMRDAGTSLLYVSHRLDEVVSVVDDVTILRNGRVVSSAGSTRVDVESIVSAMIGAAVAEHYPKERHSRPEVVLEARGISTAAGVRNVSLELRRGEVLGLGGVLGSGRTEIARALFGADRLTGGEIRLDGRPLRLRSPSDAIDAGIGLISENRKFDGLFPNFTSRRNISVASLEALKRAGFLSLGEEGRATDDLLKRLEVTAGAADKAVGHLSGGNQQKVILARWLLTKARILVLDEPTQGIDIGAKLAIYHLINALAAEGKSVILISADHEELLAMSDRVALVCHGVVTDIRPASSLGPGDLVRASAEISTRTKTEERHEVPA